MGAGRGAVKTGLGGATGRGGIGDASAGEPRSSDERGGAMGGIAGGGTATTGGLTWGGTDAELCAGSKGRFGGGLLGIKISKRLFETSMLRTLTGA